MSVNRVFLIGRLGRDPEIVHPTKGNQITNFNIATDESWTDKQGERRKKTEWHKIVSFGKLAEICGQYLCKGMQVFIGGKLQTREWTDKEGNKRYSTEIVAQEIKMLGGRREDGSGTREPSMDDEDIPF